MNEINYQKRLEQELARIGASGRRPALLLHVCCAPCASYVLEYLSAYFDMTIYYYNPNIFPAEEYRHRVEELRRFVSEFAPAAGVRIEAAEYDPATFQEAVAGYEQMQEGSERCFRCYELRLTEAARKADEGRYDYFTTSLSISPMKNAKWLNEIGERLAETYHVPYLYSDFKKRDGYKRSIELSAEYGLYRQNYCGCEYSYQEALARSRQTAEA